MTDPKNPNPSSTSSIREPMIFEIDDSIYPPEPIVELPLEERFRDHPTPVILHLLNRDTLIPEARASALAELARRGVPPPPA